MGNGSASDISVGFEGEGQLVYDRSKIKAYIMELPLMHFHPFVQ